MLHVTNLIQELVDSITEKAQETASTFNGVHAIDWEVIHPNGVIIAARARFTDATGAKYFLTVTPEGVPLATIPGSGPSWE